MCLSFIRFHARKYNCKRKKNYFMTFLFHVWNRVGEKKFWQENFPISFTHMELRSKIAYVFFDETKMYFHSTSHKNSVVFFFLSHEHRKRENRSLKTNFSPAVQLLSLTLAVFDWGQSDAVLQQILFGLMVHGGADGQHGARLLLLQQVWRQKTDKSIQLHTIKCIHTI